MRIRPATRGDVGAIQRVGETAWYEAHAPIAGEAAVASFLDEYYDRRTIRGRVKSDDWLVFVAAESDVVGFAAATEAEAARPDVFALTNLYVVPERWGEGVGTRLLARVETGVAGRDATRLRLAVMAENDRAVGFYESRGFERVQEGYDDRLDVARYVYAKDL